MTSKQVSHDDVKTKIKELLQEKSSKLSVKGN